VNGLTYDANVDVGAAGVQFPLLQRFFVAVDSRADPFTDKPLKGKYLLNAWLNDVTPPAVRLLTTRITVGRPLIVAQAVDLGSGVDPLSLVINYNKALVGASAYDPSSGLIVFGIPTAAPKFKAGKTSSVISASDYQESKNINTVGNDIYPQHDLPAHEDHGRERPDAHLDRTARARLRAEEGSPRRGRRLEQEGQGGRVPRQRQAHRDRQERPRRRLHRDLEDGEPQEGRPPPDGDAPRFRGRHSRCRPAAEDLQVENRCK